MRFAKFAKDYGIIGAILALLVVGVSDHYEIKNIRESLKRDAEQDKQIELLWRAQIHWYNDLNDLSKRARSPGYPWPDDLH